MSLPIVSSILLDIDLPPALALLVALTIGLSPIFLVFLKLKSVQIEARKKANAKETKIADSIKETDIDFVEEIDIDFDEETDIEDEEILADNMIYCSNWTFFDFDTIVLNDGTEDEELVTLFPDEITYFKYDEILKTIYLTHENVGYVLEVTNDEQIKAVDEIKELLNEKQYYTNGLSVEEQRQIINALASSLQMESKPEKDASVIGRAVVGGVIAGPTGAVVGALSAVDKNNKKRK